MSNNQSIIIAIDGYSSCGKSTVAKSLAKHLAYSFIDTGAMYRAVTLHMVRNKIPYAEVGSVESELERIDIRFVHNPERKASDTYLNGECVEDEIRQMAVSSQVSNYAAIKAVRVAMVKQQQAMGNQGGVILDGRDIGTVVFPNAQLKIFMTASPQIRAQRRFDELRSKGQQVNLEEVMENLKERDHIDSTREESPLRQAEDALILDNSHMTMDEQLELVINWVKEVV